MADPKVLIGIPTLNGPGRLERCLRSIKKFTDLKSHGAEVIVSDDCSYEKKLEENKRVCGAYRIPMLMAETRVGVAEQWNRLVRHSQAPIQILMNDDVEVAPDWLDALVFSLNHNPHAGMIGLKAYTGVTSENYSPPLPPSYMEAVMERGRGLLSSTGYLFGFMKNKWEAIEGFDTRFFAFYEEIDFGVRLFKRGWPSYMLSYPIVIHQGGASTSDPGNLDAKNVLLESREKFREKHGSIEQVRNDIIAVDEDSSTHRPKLIQWNTALKTTVE